MLTSLMAHRNRVLADYNTAELREVYLEIPSTHGGRKTFLVIEEGHLDGSEGYRVEDEDEGKDGHSQLAEAVPSGTTAATNFFSEYNNPLNFSFMATEDKTEEAFISQPLTLSATVLRQKQCPVFHHQPLMVCQCADCPHNLQWCRRPLRQVLEG